MNPDYNSQATQTHTETAYTADPYTGVESATHTVKNENVVTGTEKTNQIIWFIVGVLNTLLALRVIFLLLSAKNVGFTKFLYNITNPFVLPFQGVFPVNPATNSYFDTAGLLAIAIYTLLAWGIIKLIQISSQKKV